MTGRTRLGLRLLFISTAALTVYFAEQSFEKKRIEQTIRMVHDVQYRIAYEYDFPTNPIVPGLDDEENSEIQVHKIASASPPFIYEQPTNPVIRQALGTSFPKFVQANWKWAKHIYNQYQDRDTRQPALLDGMGYQQSYNFETNAGNRIELIFHEPGKLVESREKTPHGLVKCQIMYNENTNPDSLTFSAPTSASLRLEMSYTPSGVLKYFATFFQRDLLGVGLIWHEDGSLQEEVFYSRPQKVYQP